MRGLCFLVTMLTVSGFLRPTFRLSPGRSTLRKAASKAENLNTLVIVESPAKAKTIQKILPSDRYTVDFCLGHVRDLLKQSQVPKEIKQEDPDAKMGIRVAGGSFIPLYMEIPSKSSIVKRLKSKLKICQELVLATDEDREGEAISWHHGKSLGDSILDLGRVHSA